MDCSSNTNQDHHPSAANTLPYPCRRRASRRDVATDIHTNDESAPPPAPHSRRNIRGLPGHSTSLPDSSATPPCAARYSGDRSPFAIRPTTPFQCSRPSAACPKRHTAIGRCPLLTPASGQSCSSNVAGAHPRESSVHQSPTVITATMPRQCRKESATRYNHSPNFENLRSHPPCP